MSIAQLMQLKLFLNKFLKIDNIEYYTLSALTEIKKAYEKFLETSEGTDPDFPMINFGDKGNEKYSKSNNKHSINQKYDSFDDLPFPEQETLKFTR